MTIYNPNIHNRHSIRLRGYDYSQVGAYYVTINTHQRECIFGEILDGLMQLSDLGRIVNHHWGEIPNHFQHVLLNTFVVMPNHVHGVLILTDVGARHAVPLQPKKVVNPKTEQFGKPVSGSIPTIIRSFKSSATKHINELRGTPGASVWQRNYHEHIIRDENDLQDTREYIINNPAQWEEDEYYTADEKLIEQAQHESQ